MSKTENTALVWYRNDLRTVDHQGLKKAVESGLRVIACYAFNPSHFETLPWGFKKTDRFRAKFLIESVEALKESLEALNISLVIETKTPDQAIPEWIKKYNVKEIYLQHEWTEEETKEEQAVKRQIDPNIRWIKHYEQFLFHPADLPFSRSEIPEIFGVFRKRCEKEINVRSSIPSPTPLDYTNRVEISDNLPNLSDLCLPPISIDERSAFPFMGGTKKGVQRLNQYFWKSKKLSFYKNTRNGLVGTDYSSKFSPWLANGSISAKTIYWEIKRYEKDVQKNQSTYWLIFELIWRDYFKYICLKHGNKTFKIGGILERDYHWNTQEDLFRQWVEGLTPEPFINANMIELKQTGWMSNRGRQNVASYFAKDMKMDWRMGAAYFESMLIDYDVHSNYGNWMYVSGVGNDPRDRKFDVQWQAQRYDPNGKFQYLWLQKTLFR
jgi:deoxyribodipyrimidine photo-lyase